MTTDQIKTKTRHFLAGRISGDFPDDEDLFQSGALNSLFALQLVTFVESEFQIRVETDDLDLRNFHGVNAIADFVQRKLAA